MKPIFVVLEGIDRCGKTTQAELLRQRIVSLGLPVRAYGTPDRRTETGRLAARLLRGNIEVTGDPAARGDASVQPYDEELLLQCALTCNRYEVAARVRRNLGQGISVICVRWWPSAVAYAAEDGIDDEEVRETTSFLPEPDLYVLLDVDPEAVAGRLDPGERYEASSGLQERIRCRYLRLWEERRCWLPVKWSVVRADHDASRVSEDVWRCVTILCPELLDTRQVKMFDDAGFPDGEKG